MRATNNSMETLLDDQTAEHQRDDKRHMTFEIFPSESSNSMASEEKPSPPPTQIARCNNSFKHVHRTFWIVIQDIEATKKFHKHPNYKHRDVKASINALERLIQQYNLLHKNQAGTICQPSGEGLRKTLQSIWGPHKSRDVGSSKTIWLASKRDWNISYLRTVENAYNELTLDESLPEYNPAHAEPFNTDAGGHGEEEGSRFGRAGFSESKQSNEITGAKVQGNLKSEIEQPALDTIAVSPMTVLSPLTQLPTPELQTFHRKSSLERLATSTNQYRPVKQVGSPDASRTKASTVETAGQKRKVASSVAHTSRRSRQKPETTNSDGLKSVFPSIVTLEDDRPSLKEERVKIPSPAISRTERPEMAEGTGDKLLKTSLPHLGPALWLANQHNVSNQLTLLPLRISQIQRDLTEIRTDMLAATTELLGTIGNVRSATMPLCPKANTSALELQVKCWGPQWSAVRSELVALHLFPAFEVLMSLCSAFLVTVFDQECSLMVEFRLQLNSGGAYGRAIASLLEDQTFVKSVHALVSNDSEAHEAELMKDVHSLTGDLWNRILPHMIWLSTQAEIQGQKHSGGTSSLNDQSIWFHIFESMTEPIIQKALRLRTRLSGTNCEISFLWPNDGESFDLRTMQGNAGVAPNIDPMTKRRVAFTTFPGLEVTATNMGVKKTSVAYKAVVKLYPHSC